MKDKIRRLGVISMLVLSSFTLASVAQPVPAHALIGVAVWPLFPLAIVGAALEVDSIVTEGVALSQYCRGFTRAARDTDLTSAALFLVGLVFLDENGGLALQEVTQEQAQKYGLTDAEMQAYNQAVDNGQMQEILESATDQLGKQQQGSGQEPTFTDAKGVMQGLLSSLPDDAHHAFTKISQYLVQNSQAGS